MARRAARTPRAGPPTGAPTGAALALVPPAQVAAAKKAQFGKRLNALSSFATEL